MDCLVTLTRADDVDASFHLESPDPGVPDFASHSSRLKRTNVPYICAAQVH